MKTVPKGMFVIDCRHNCTSEAKYEVRKTWVEALKVARKFWESYDMTYDENAKQPFKVGQDYAEELEADMKPGKSLYVSHAGGEGPFIRIEKVKD